MSETAFPAFLSPRRLPNPFDLAAAVCILGSLVYVVGVARGTLAPIDAPEATTIVLDPMALPGYAVRTTLRMFAALFCSLIFTFTYATLAAKSRRAGLILIPILDVLQSANDCAAHQPTVPGYPDPFASEAKDRLRCASAFCHERPRSLCVRNMIAGPKSR